MITCWFHSLLLGFIVTESGLVTEETWKDETVVM